MVRSRENDASCYDKALLVFSVTDIAIQKLRDTILGTSTQSPLKELISASDAYERPCQHHLVAPQQKLSNNRVFVVSTHP
jgi:hypothetical protein